MDRGQAHTLEAFMAALLLISGVLFALDATAVTPLSASTSNQHIQNQQLSVANDLLATAAANGTLQEAVLYWNTSTDSFDGTGSDGYYTAGPPNAFGKTLNETFHDERIAFNVYVSYWKGSTRKEQPMTFMGSPSDNAVTASRTVTLYNDTALTAPGETKNVSTAAVDGNFYASDSAPGSELFTVVEVRIVAWRM